MFEKLRGKLNGLINRIATTELKPESLRPILWELKLALLENDVAVVVADHVCEEVEKRLVGKQLKRLEDRRTIVKETLREVLFETLKLPSINMIDAVNNKRKPVSLT